MFEFIKEKLFGQSSSKSVAKSRLHFVLVQDRTGLNNDELANFKKELMDVFERYFVVDKSGFDVNYKREGETTTLFINSPIIVRRQDSPDKGDVGARKRLKAKDGASAKEEEKPVVDAPAVGNAEA